MLAKIENRQVEGMTVLQLSELIIGETGSEVLLSVKRPDTPNAIDVRLIRGGISLKMLTASSPNLVKVDKIVPLSLFPLPSS